MVVLSTNRRVDTLACLESLVKNTYPSVQVVAVDNQSTDGSAEAVLARFPNVTLIELQTNRGYAGNNNVGIQFALTQAADWVLILNEDTIMAPDCIERLIGAVATDAQIGMAGPMIYHYDEPNVIQTAGGVMDRFWSARHLGHNDLDLGQYVEPHPVDWLSGCALMVRRSLIEQLGVLDERLFIYWEEIDWCIRANRAGWRLVHVPQAKIWHKGVQRNYRPKPNVTYYSIRNQFLILKKHGAPWLAQVYQWLQTFRTLLSWTIRPKWHHMRDHRDALWQGLCDYVTQRWGMRRV